MSARDQLRAALAQMASALRSQLREDAVPKAAAYGVTRRGFVSAMADAFLTYVSSARGGSAKRDAGRAVIESISAAFYRGFRDGGGEETEKADEDWLTAAQKSQLAYLDSAFDSLKVQRDKETATEDGLRGRAEVWGATLDGVYAEGKLRANKAKMLTWHYGDTDHCATCRKLDGQRHRASWYLKRDYIPGKPGAAMDCHGYRCQCRLEDDDGKTVTI